MNTLRLPRFRAAGLLLVCIAFCCLLLACGGRPESDQGAATTQIRIAVASNFSATLKQLIHEFESEQDVSVTVVTASTGNLYAQIVNGAPFDILLAADQARPLQLEKGGLAIADSRFTYAIGKLLLWSPIGDYFQVAPGRSDISNSTAVTQPMQPTPIMQSILTVPADCRHFAIANPKHAPYGRAAEEVLLALGLWEELEDRLVRGENIGQAFQFVQSGSAQMGFVSYSQVKRPGEPILGSYWLVPQELYAPIHQQAILLHDAPATRAFMDFLGGDVARQILHDYGYGTP